MINNLPFRQKIWLLPLGAAVVFAIGVVVSFVVGARTAASLDHLARVDSPTQTLVQKAEAHVENVRLTLQTAVAEGDPDKLAEVQATVDKTRLTLKELRAIEDSRPLAEKLSGHFERYQGSALAATRAMLTKADPGAALAQMQEAQKALMADLGAAAQQSAAAVAQTQDVARQGTRMAQWTSVVTGVAALLVLGLVSVAVIRSVWHDLGEEPAELKRMVRAIAEGNLAVQPAVRQGDQRSLNAALAQMLAQLRGAVGTIRLAAESISTSSAEIAQGSQDLSHRTETAASNLQVTASSVATLTESVGHSSHSARQASDLAGTAASAAQHGGHVMTQVVSNMQEIDTASRRIAEITGVIDSIAFQTNILALNAAVEAARAGDQGRGFAVVASEVRTLASRSAEAAREIRTLIGSSVEKVESGAKLVNAAGTAMDEIVAGVSRVTSVVGEISASASEQSSGISQVNEAVSELDRMTQQNAALVEQSAAAAESMREQAVRLGEAVAIFRIGH